MYMAKKLFSQAQLNHVISVLTYLDLFFPGSNSGITDGPGQIKFLEIYTRVVNQNPKFLDFRKSPNPIRTSVGFPIFSWTVFEPAISYSKFHAFSTL